VAHVFCRACGDAVCKPWISVTCLLHMYEHLQQSVQSMGVCQSRLPAAPRCAAGRRRLHLRQKNLAPPSCTRHAQLRAAGL
jgi:hypothetical protein